MTNNINYRTHLINILNDKKPFIWPVGINNIDTVLTELSNTIIGHIKIYTNNISDINDSIKNTIDKILNCKCSISILVESDVTTDKQIEFLKLFSTEYHKNIEIKHGVVEMVNKEYDFIRFIIIGKDAMILNLSKDMSYCVYMDTDIIGRFTDTFNTNFINI